MKVFLFVLAIVVALVIAVAVKGVRGRCNLCGRTVLLTPTRRLVLKAYGVLFCDSCIPQKTISQLAQVSGKKLEEKSGRPTG